MAELLAKQTHFNYTANIIQALVPHLNSKDDDVVEAASSAIIKVFKNDDNGRWSLEVSFIFVNYITIFLIICISGPPPLVGIYQCCTFCSSFPFILS